MNPYFTRWEKGALQVYVRGRAHVFCWSKDDFEQAEKFEHLAAKLDSLPISCGYRDEHGCECYDPEGHDGDHHMQ